MSWLSPANVCYNIMRASLDRLPLDRCTRLESTSPRGHKARFPLKPCGLARALPVSEAPVPPQVAPRPPSPLPHPVTGALLTEHSGTSIHPRASSNIVRVRAVRSCATLVRALAAGEPSVSATGRGGNPLTDSVAVELMLSLLTLLDQPRHLIARFHVWRSPLGRMVDPDSDPLAEPNSVAFGAFAIQGRQRVLEVGYAEAAREWMSPLLGQADAYDLERLSQLLDLLASGSIPATLRPLEVVTHIRAQKIASSSVSRVQVMTIHQSKGLEFDVVILPDLEGPLVRPDALLTLHSDPLGSPELVSAYAADTIAEAHPKLGQMRDAQIAQAVQSSLCVLYVALTRAKHATHCIIEPSPPSQKDLPMTYAGILRGALTEPGAPAVAGTVLWSADGAKLDWKLERAGVVAAAVESSPRAWVPPRTGGAQHRNLPRTSPSRLEGDAQVKGARALASDSRALVRGTVIHGWLEALPWLEKLPEHAALVESGVLLGATRAEAREWASAFLESLERPTLHGLLTRPAEDVEVRVEQSFEMTVEPGARFAHREVEERTLVSGSMDRLVIFREGEAVVRAEVIDYKTDVLDASDPAAVAERLKHYAPQLAVYRLAAARMLGCSEDRVRTSLMFLHTDTRISSS